MKPHNLHHQANTFVGRAAEIAECTSLLHDPACHLLTLTGSGGVGKTRLAVEVAAQMMESFCDGVYFVPLQPLNSADHVVSAIVSALPLQQRGETNLQQQLFDYLHDKQMLLLLDNMEHLLAFSPVIATLIRSAPQVRLLVTSREPLKLQEEWVRQVAGLAYPLNATADGAGDSGGTSYSAMELFTECVRRRTRNFDLAQEYHDIVRLCQLVDGVPLALELAASWIKVMSCAAIVDEIQQDISILSTTLHNVEDRHRSMRAVFDHSWELLTDDEQIVMRRLAVFRGGFTRDVAAAIAGATLPILASLVDKSMVRVDSDGRYDLHELLRQYAAERLIASGEHEATYDAHARYYAGFVHQRTDDLKGRRQIPALQEFRADFDNVRAAWIWAVDQQRYEVISHMIDGLWIFHDISSRRHDHLFLFHYAEQHLRLHHDNETKPVWGRLLARTAMNKDSQSRFETALNIAHEYHDRGEIAFCLLRLAMGMYNNHEHEKAQHLLEQSLAIYKQLEDRFGQAQVYLVIMSYNINENWDDFEYCGNMSLRLRREIGDQAGVATALVVAALAETRLGRFTAAEAVWHERITLAQAVENYQIVASSKAHLGQKVYFFQGEFARARAVAEESIALARQLGATNFIAWSLVTLGILACMEENYQEGMGLCQQGAATRHIQDVSNIAAWGLAVARCGLGDYQTARESLKVASTFFITILGLTGIVSSAPIIAILLAHEGNTVRAVEFLGFAFTHPVGVSGWMKQWPLLDRLRADLEQALDTDTYAAAWERGKTLTTGEVVAEMTMQPIAQLSNNSSQQIIEPLSSRELEILSLISNGLTNREIAVQLFISVSTVKKHINHIYDKLIVKNRTSAVARARELNILE